MRISYITNPDGTNSNYRAYQPMHALERRGHSATFNRRGQPQVSPAVFDADVVHIHRYIGREMLAVVEQLRARGIGVVWDNDDDITNVPRSNPHYAKFGGARRPALVKNLNAMLGAVDAVTTPSAHLAAQFRAAGAHDVRVIENYLPDSFPGAKVAKSDGVTVVWLAGLEHQVDYQRLQLQDTLVRLLDAHTDLRILSIGLGLGLRTDRYEHVKLVDFLGLPRALARGDIGIAPLVELPWNAARSNVKVKEYAAAGLPWLASDFGAYRGLGEAQGGRLVPDDGWHEALDELIRDARGRKKLAKRAAKWAKGETISKHVDAWEAVYRDAHARAQRRL